MPTSIEKFTELRERLARDPGNEALLYDTCIAGEDIAFEETLVLFAERVNAPPVNPAIRLNDLHLYAILREKQGRRAAGLSTTNARGVADLDFVFARSDLAALVRESHAFLAKYPDSVGAAILLAEALASFGSLGKAETVFSSLRRLPDDHVATAANFDPRFRETLGAEAARSLSKLPELKTVRAVPKDQARVVLTAADYLYFQKFGWMLVDSFAKTAGTDTLLSLHIMDMTPEETDAVSRRLEGYAGLHWALSTEWTGLRGGPQKIAVGYYHAVRFIRYWQFLVQNPAAATWLIDTDTIFNGGPSRLFDTLAGHDLALFLAPGRFEVRNKVVACCTGASNTDAAREFIRDVAGYVAAYWEKGKLPWGIDQVAMYAVLAMPQGNAPRVASLPPDIINGSRTPDALLWPAKG